MDDSGRYARTPRNGREPLSDGVRDLLTLLLLVVMVAGAFFGIWYVAQTALP